MNVLLVRSFHFTSKIYLKRKSQPKQTNLTFTCMTLWVLTDPSTSFSRNVLQNSRNSSTFLLEKIHKFDGSVPCSGITTNFRRNFWISRTHNIQYQYILCQFIQFIFIETFFVGATTVQQHNKNVSCIFRSKKVCLANDLP